MIEIDRVQPPSPPPPKRTDEDRHTHTQCAQKEDTRPLWVIDGTPIRWDIVSNRTYHLTPPFSHKINPARLHKRAGEEGGGGGGGGKYIKTKNIRR